MLFRSVPYDQTEILSEIKNTYTIQAIFNEEEGYRIQLKYYPELKAKHKVYERRSHDHHHNPKH